MTDKPDEAVNVTDEANIIKVAKAINSIKGGMNYSYEDFCRDAAKAAIEAMSHRTATEADLRAQLATIRPVIEMLHSHFGGAVIFNKTTERFYSELSEALAALSDHSGK